MRTCKACSRSTSSAVSRQASSGRRRQVPEPLHGASTKTRSPEAGVFDHDEIEDFDDLVDFDDDEGGYEGAVPAAATADEFDDLSDDDDPDPIAEDYLA